MVDNSNPSIILDNGSGYLKCGMSNHQYPEFTLPALVGRPMLRYEEDLEGLQIKVIFCF
jgi:actin-related protein 2